MSFSSDTGDQILKVTFPKCVVMSSPGPLKVNVYQLQAFINPGFGNTIVVLFCPGTTVS